MKNGLKIFYFFNILYIFFLSLNSVITIENLETIILNNETISLNSLTIPSYFKIITQSESNLPNYIKLQVNQNNLTENFTTFLISYYQKPDFKERKQFSQSSLGTAFIWLNSEQIKNEFYISIESTQKIYNNNLYIYLKEKVEISLNEQYTYYVSEENKKMSFTIINDISDYFGQNILSIWAKGNQNINSILENANYIKHSKYNAYLIYQEEFEQVNYNFTVNGEIGDIINIGSILFELEEDPISHIIFNNNEIEITGFLRRNYIEKNCYKFGKINSFFEYASYVIYDNIESFQESNQYNYNDENYDLKCIEFPDNTEVDELFYSIYYTPIDNSNNDVERINKFFPIQINGFNYKKYIKNGETIGLIPIIPNYDFDYLTYYVNDLKGKINISLYNCESYPLCDVNLNNIKEVIPIQNYYSYSYSFSKNELNNNILSNINREKKVMLISCQNKNEIDTDTGKENDNCLIDTNIYTNKNLLLLNHNYNYHKYIRKNNKDNYLIIGEYDGNPKYINIEILSGDITININYTYLYEKNNKKLYIIENNENSKLEFSISAKTNSLYNIRYYIQEFNQHFAMAGGSYLFSIPNNSDSEEGIILFNNYEYFDNTAQELYFLGFYPLNCKINLEYYYIPFEFIPIKDKQGFYQDFSGQNTQIYKHFGYRITKNDNILEDCLFYISIFKYNNETIYDNNGIFLGNNISQLFAFDNNYSFLKFSYAYVDKDKDVNIFFKLLNEEKYKLNLFINEKGLNKYNIIKDEKIIIKLEDIKEICNNEQQMCKISFSLLSENIHNESIIEITINTTEKKESDDSSDSDSSNDSDDSNGSDGSNNSNDINNSDNNYVLIITIIIIVFILVVIIIIFILKFKNKKKDNLNNEIDNIKSDTQEMIISDKDN